MAFDDWRRACAQATRDDERRRAQLWNLEHETRIDVTLGEFKDRVAAVFEDALVSNPPIQAALAALAAAQSELQPADSRWLGALPCDPRETTRSATYTHFCSTQLERFRTRAPSYGSVPATSSFPTTETIEFSLIAGRRFIWIAWAPETLDLPDDPTVLKRELGLAHFPASDCVYRWSLTIEPFQTFVPTCLDARLDEAWKPPPSGHPFPWGLTRDLTTGESRWPELLVEARNYLGIRIRATRLGGADTPARIGPVTEDYMAGRS